MIAPGRSLAVSRATLAFGATAPSTDPAIGHAARQRRHKKADVQSAVLYLAEREGFEPSIQFDPYTPLAGEPLRPLGHLSESLQFSVRPSAIAVLADGGITLPLGRA